MKAHSTILCPVDFSDAGMAGLDAAVAMAERIDAEILLLHAVPPLPLPVPSRGPATFDVEGYSRELLESAKRELRDLAGSSIPESLSVRSVVVTGAAAEEICRVADNENVSMIVMATHGQADARAAVSGSTTEKVVRCACCPVLAVPIPDPSRGDSTTFVRDWGDRTKGSEL
jgi:nucleotide-binding universal stress UspA family protein